MRITPDSRLTNDGVEQFTQSLCLYKTPIQRWNGKGLNSNSFLSFETVIKQNEVSFNVTVLKEHESVTRKAIETAWPRVKIETIIDPFTKQPNQVATVSMNYHYMFAIRVDKRENRLLSSLLQTLTSMNSDDEVYIQTFASPASPDWYQSATEAYERFKKGQMSQKIRLDKEGISKIALKSIAYPIFGTINVLTELLTGELEKPLHFADGERALILRDRNLRSESLQKVRGDAYDVAIRVGIICNDASRTDSLLRMVTTAFRELDGDNQLISKKENPNKLWRLMKERKMGIRLQKDYFSIAELARLHVLPFAALQEKFKVSSIKQLETDIQEELLIGGMYFGEYEFKGKKHPIYYSTENAGENWNYLCKQRVVIGPPGCGKTRGFGANIAVEAVRNGFSSLVVDPAKGQMGDEIEASLPPEQVNRIRLGKEIISLDFCEVRHSERSKNRLARTLVAFFNNLTDEAGGQTSRYLEAAIMSMQTTKLSEILRIFEDEDYRNDCISKMRDSLHKTTLKRFNDEKGRHNQILSPIYNRLNIILGDEYLEQCLESDNSIDLVEVLRKPGMATVIDVRVDDLGTDAVDLIVNLLSIKLDIAMTLRPEEEYFPFFVVFDEPHSFLKSAAIWKSAAITSRKYRVTYTWMFHTWEQIPNNLQEIIESADPHYHIYRASKKTFNSLSYEIQPFTVEDGLKLEAFHSINIVKMSDNPPKPFIAKMAMPPSQRRG